MKVAKFGGSSLASAAQVEKVCAIIEQDPGRRVIVVSAPGKRSAEDTKVTDLLIQLANAALGGESIDALLQQIVNRYAEIAQAFGVTDQFVKTIEKDLTGRLAGKYASEGQFMDAMKAAGEDNSARLIAEILQQRGVDAHYVNPKDGGMMLSDEAGNARVLPKSYKRLYTLRARPGVTIFPGFFGYSENGHIVTFPRGGSDITGAILAAAVEADIYENFTDVDSVLVANPAFVKNPVPIASLTYREMRELSYAGFSVFHDEALEPVVHAGIPVHVRNTNNPNNSGTAIVKARQISSEYPVVGIAATDGFCSIFISKYLMNRQIGFGRRVLQVLEEAGISYEHTPSGIDNMSVVIRESNFPKSIERSVLDKLQEAVQADDVTVERGIALVMVVGEGMTRAVGLTGRAGAALGRGGVNIEMINQGSSEVSMMFGVKAEEMQTAVQSLYSEFFG
ncbi:MAG: aspartate kinase [Rhodothermales bacterium]